MRWLAWVGYFVRFLGMDLSKIRGARRKCLMAMGFIFLILTYRFADLLARTMPLKLSWLAFQFAATWAFTYVTGRMVKSYTQTVPTELQHLQLIVWLGRGVMVLVFWLAFAQSVVLSIFAPHKAVPMSWFTSPKASGLISYAWGLSLAVLSVRLAPGLLRIVDALGWMWGPLLFHANALLWPK